MVGRMLKPFSSQIYAKRCTVSAWTVALSLLPALNIVQGSFAVVHFSCGIPYVMAHVDLFDVRVSWTTRGNVDPSILIIWGADSSGDPWQTELLPVQHRRLGPTEHVCMTRSITTLRRQKVVILPPPIAREI